MGVYRVQESKRILVVITDDFIGSICGFDPVVQKLFCYDRSFEIRDIPKFLVDDSGGNIVIIGNQRNKKLYPLSFEIILKGDQRLDIMLFDKRVILDQLEFLGKSIKRSIHISPYATSGTIYIGMILAFLFIPHFKESLIQHLLLLLGIP